MTIDNLAVIGAGTMGHGIAQVFAQAGLQVTLTDLDARVLGSAIQRIETNLETCWASSPDAKENAATVAGRIKVASDLAEAVSDTDFVVEAVFEDLDVKRKVLDRLERYCPGHIVLASTTSSYCVRDMALTLENPERFLVTHFWNPPYLIPIVEVMPGQHTAAWAVETTFTLLDKAGKIPALVKKDTPGFVGNRLQHALRREALAIVTQGIASPEDVDLITRLSFGLRMPVVGPLETVDLGGLDLTLAIQSYLLPDLDRSTEPSQNVRDKVERGELGAKTGQGFYDWTPSRTASVIQRRDEALLEMMGWLAAHGLLGTEPHQPTASNSGQGTEQRKGKVE